MPIIVKEKVGQQVPVGTHIALCYRIVDLGTQPGNGYADKEKLLIFWELPYERINIDGKDLPMSISRFYGKTIGKKSILRGDLVSWRGREFTPEELEHFELKNILGKACQISVVANTKGDRHVVDAVVSIPKGTQVPNVTNPLVEYSIHDGQNETFKALPEWVQKICLQCLEWNGQTKKEPAIDQPPDLDGDDVPF